MTNFIRVSIILLSLLGTLIGTLSAAVLHDEGAYFTRNIVICVVLGNIVFLIFALTRKR